ncbi:hypothetical protein SEPCBS57363_002264 [Sporothrix epigloea]|uniref:HNH nuclease domain-containing protein n=1 Tax=Sporothrix epigloea TaxID=1892477 RepID=A0ABP0DEW3_9PEZI
MAATTVARGVLDHNHLVVLLASIGAGEEAVQRALRERATSAPIVPGADVDFHKQNLAYDVVYRLLLPFRAISEAVGSVPADGSDGSDSEDGSSTGGSSCMSLGVDHNGSAFHHMSIENTTQSFGRTFIFPPSPLLALGQPESDDNPHTDSAIQAARCIDLVDPEAIALLQDTANDTQASTVILNNEWSNAFLRFEAVIVPRDPDILDGVMVVRPVKNKGSRGAELLVFQPGALSRRLLALHAKMARILYETHAGKLIDDLLSDNANAEGLAGDGGTHVGLLMQLRLDGWSPAKKKRRGRWSQRRGGLEDTDATMIWIEDAILVQEDECR